MASEWVGVVGTAIGAGIGGVVTVVSLVVKGRQETATEQRRIEREDGLRTEDRDWSVRFQNVEDRRSLYGRLLRLGGELTQAGLFQLVPMKSGSEKFHRDADDNARDKLAEYLEEAGAAEVYAVDPTVTETAKELGQAASSVINKVWLFGVGSDTERQELAQTLNRIDSDLLPALRHACRRDLGLAVRVGPVRA